jgi:hypothetical protein
MLLRQSSFSKTSRRKTSKPDPFGFTLLYRERFMDFKMKMQLSD